MKQKLCPDALALVKAKALIKRGWCQYNLATDASGKGVDPTSPDACNWCLVGALNPVLGDEVGRTMKLIGLIRDQIPFVRPDLRPSVPAFNDSLYTTKEMVLKLLSLAIRKAQIDAGLATARFWTWNRGEYDEGLVKISLRPQQGMAVGGGGPTDEGWQVWGVGWEHVGSCVEMYCTRRGMDCDGPYEQWADYKCPIEDLDLLDGEPGEPGFPMWERVSGGQRDHNAEAMGY